MTVPAIKLAAAIADGISLSGREAVTKLLKLVKRS